MPVSPGLDRDLPLVVVVGAAAAAVAVVVVGGGGGGAAAAAAAAAAVSFRVPTVHEGTRGFRHHFPCLNLDSYLRSFVVVTKFGPCACFDVVVASAVPYLVKCQHQHQHHWFRIRLVIYRLTNLDPKCRTDGSYY